jgi:hypothetical protein
VSSAVQWSGWSPVGLHPHGLRKCIWSGFSKDGQSRAQAVTRQGIIVVLSVGAVIVAGSFIGCPQSETGEGQRVPAKSIEQVLKENTDTWMAVDGIEGTAIGLYKGKPCIKIFTSVKTQELRGRIPPAVEGYPVIIEQTGVFRALDEQ